MKKIVITQDLLLTDEQKNRLKSLGEVTEYTTTPSDEEWLSRVQWQDIILSEEPGLFVNLYNIKDSFLTFPFTGFLWEVDIEKLKSNNVTTAAAKGGNKYAVAEWTITALLNLTRCTKDIQSGTLRIDPANLASLPVTGIYGLNVVILGKGHIGSQVGKSCEVLGANVDYFMRWDNLSEKLKNKHVVINCLSGNDETKWLLNEEMFSNANFPFYYITAMRETIHDANAIAKLLSNGKMVWYADDCATRPAGDTTNEYYKTASSLHGNTFITPHIAWAAKSWIYYSNEVMIDNVEKYLGWNPQNLLY